MVLVNLKKINWVAVGSLAAVAGLVLALKPDILGGGGDFYSGKSGTVKGGLTPDSGETAPETKKETVTSPAAPSGGTGYTPSSFGNSSPTWEQISPKIKADMFRSITAPGTEQPSSIYEMLLGKKSYTGMEAAQVFQYTPKGQLMSSGAYTPKPFYPGAQNGNSFFGNVGKGSEFNKQMMQFLGEPGAAGNIVSKKEIKTEFDRTSAISAARGCSTASTYGGRPIEYSGIGEGDSYLDFSWAGGGKNVMGQTAHYYTRNDLSSDIRFKSASEAAAYIKKQPA
jgi:hypothetical protein